MLEVWSQGRTVPGMQGQLCGTNEGDEGEGREATDVGLGVGSLSVPFAGCVTWGSSFDTSAPAIISVRLFPFSDGRYSD